MKIRNSSKLLFFALLALVLMLTGCKDKSNMLAKEWRLENLKYTREIPKAMQPSIDQSIKKIKDSYSIRYEINGNYYTNMEGQITRGTWKLNWNSGKIVSTTDGGIKTVYDIIELTDDRFSFKAMEGKEEVIFILVPAKKSV